MGHIPSGQIMAKWSTAIINRTKGQHQTKTAKKFQKKEPLKTALEVNREASNREKNHSVKFETSNTQTLGKFY